MQKGLVSMQVSQAVQAMLLLFIAVDPIGNAPLFYGITAELESSVRRAIVRKSIVVATIILLIFALAGDLLLYYFGLMLADFRIAGGIILLIYGIAGIFGRTEAEAMGRPEEAEAIAIVPLATPLLAGPAAIATVLYLKAAYGLVVSLLSIIINSAITFTMLYHSQKLMELLGRSGAIALSKIMSILLAAIAVAMIREGVYEVIAKARMGFPR
jgi:multiple antibiotic resistance protein